MYAHKLLGKEGTCLSGDWANVGVAMVTRISTAIAARACLGIP